MRHIADRERTLGDLLVELYPDSSGRTRKQMLETGRVAVNGAIVRVAKTALGPGDVVEVGARGVPRPSLPTGLVLLHEDDDVLVVEKGPGLLTIATAKERERTAYAYLSAHVKRQDPRNKVFIVHRLDQLASGLLVFAKSVAAKQNLQDQLRARTVERRYVAVVEGRPDGDEGTIEGGILEDDPARVHVSPRGREARTRWRVIAERHPFTTLEVELESGRKHQIRAHLASIGHPVAGDPLYGSGTDPLGRLALHAATLGFDHPRTGERLRFESQPFRSFRKFLPPDRRRDPTR